MKTRIMGIFILGLISVLALAACAAQPAAVEPSAVPTAVPATEVPMNAESTAAPQPTLQEEQPTAAPQTESALDVEALIKEKVAGNHDLDRIFNATKTREEWNATLDRMIGYGAKISEEEKQIIIDYLLSRSN